MYRAIRRVLLLTMCLSTPAYSDEAARSAELRLGYIVDTNVYPPLLNGRSMVIYRDPSDPRNRRFVKPIFMPGWERFRKEVSKSCEAIDQKKQISVPISVQFSSEKLNGEVATILSKVEGPVDITKIFAYPVYALFVTSGDRDSADSVPTKIQFSYPNGVSEKLPRGTLATQDNMLIGVGIDPPILIKESCQNLIKIASSKDLSAYVFAEGSAVKINSYTMALSAFVDSKFFADLNKSEKADGFIRVSTRNGSSGIGINIAGIVGVGGAGSENSMQTVDSRYRLVNATYVQAAAEQFAIFGSVSSRSEVPGDAQGNAIVERLLDFMLGQASLVEIKIRKTADKQFELFDGEHKRALSLNEANLLMETAPSSNMKMDSKLSVDCSMLIPGAGAGKSASKSESNCGSEKKSDIKFEDKVKWERKGADWVPTSLKLYSIDTQSLKQSVRFGFETAVVGALADGQIHNLVHVSDGELTDYFSEKIDSKIQQVLAKLDGPKKTVQSIPGGLYKTIGYWQGGNYKQEFTCIPEPASPGIDYERIGAIDVETYDQRKFPQALLSLGCRGPDFCDSTGEFCVSYVRSAGCYVNKNWAAWYRERQKSMSRAPSNEELCAPPL